ncbi:MAG: hypothetical protein CM15mP18_1820 [Methanobacteriota archaeon]|nr:MAG: hypothetical protein CM15mP18_1820 [Euryarchaeota archaeon]
MDMKTIFRPKVWYIICGAMALIGGIENNINASSWAESAWGEAGVNDQSLAMEVLFGTFMIGFGAMSLTSAFGEERLRQFAVFNGGVMMAFFLMFVMLNSTGYNMPALPSYPSSSSLERPLTRSMSDEPSRGLNMD